MEHSPPPSVAPGMTFPVEAGQEYTLTDDQGESLVIVAKDDPLVIGFIEAFDSYVLIIEALQDNESSTKTMMEEAAWDRLMEKFEQLPNRIIRELKLKNGIVIPGGGTHS